MSRGRKAAEMQIETYRGNTILLDKGNSKFVIQEIAEVAPLDTVQAARNAIDRHIAEANKGVRRKVLVFSSRYYGNEEGRQIREGTLTSWSRGRGYRALEGVVSFGKTERETFSPSTVYEDTTENRAAMQRVVDIDKKIIKLKAEAEKLVEDLPGAKVPEHFNERAG